MGYMWAVNFDEENTVKIKETLELTTYFIASEIANYQLLQKLKVMSSVDMLTGVKNRNAMNNKISDITEGKTKVRYPFSVVFTDLNGLKLINDESGHNEGDNLLKKAAHILSGVFFDASVYRTGGDEFYVFAADYSQEKLERFTSDLETQLEKYNAGINRPYKVELSWGSCLAETDSNGDIDSFLRISDERMYEQKMAKPNRRTR